MSKLAGMLIATLFAISGCQPQDQPPGPQGEQSALGSQDGASEDRTAAADRRESQQAPRQSEQESFRRDTSDSALESRERAVPPARDSEPADQRPQPEL